MKVSDYIDALEWDSSLHTEGHIEAGTSAAECEDRNCPYYGSNRPLPVGMKIKLP